MKALFLIAAGVARGLTAFAASFRGEFTVLREGPLLGGNALAALAGDFTLPVGVHRREATLRGRTTCHLCLLIEWCSCFINRSRIRWFRLGRVNLCKKFYEIIQTSRIGVFGANV